MRYKVNIVGHKGGPRPPGYAIWDRRLSPFAVEECTQPVYCSLDGRDELIFKSLNSAYLWLARCERAGLDLEGEPGSVTVYTKANGEPGGELMISEPSGSGPVVRELPALWREGPGDA